MEGSRSCKDCRKRTLTPDDVTGNLVCMSCGVVQDFENFQAHIGGVTGDVGTYVRIGTSGVGSARNYKEIKVYEAQKIIEDFMYKLGLSGSKSHEVKLMIEKITDGEYGQGKWFPVFVGACAYVVMRKDNKMLPIVEVADLIGCDIYEMGRMIQRVVGFIELKLPEFDIVSSFEHALKSCPSFSEVSEDIVRIMLQQGVFLVQCLIKWFLTTGRKPIPVVAAVLVFVAELNGVQVKIEDVANELHVAVSTCKRRYKELLEALVKVAQVLPWGKDVTVKNIVKNAPHVIQYMEMKSMKSSGERKSLEDVQISAYPIEEIEYGYDSSSAEGCSSKYFELDHTFNLDMDGDNKFQMSPECLALVYSKFLDDVSIVKASSERDLESSRRRQKNFDLQACTAWWRGKSDMGRKLLLKQILEKDVGLETTPPSFQKGCIAKKRRREKIKTAKLRINRIMNPVVTESGYSTDLYLPEPEKSGKKRKKLHVEIDWEDFIIETLLLHDVGEEQIETGHYNTLLALHVF